MQKKLLILVLSILLGSTISFLQAQDLKSMGKKELDSLKTQAVQNENYSLANEIKIELESRKDTSELKKQLEEELEIAIANEDYKKASKIKEKLNLVSELNEIDSQIQTAVSSQNYKQAANLKKRKVELQELLFGSKHNSDMYSNSEQKATTTESKDNKIVKNGHFSLLIPKYDIKHLRLWDIVISDQYVASINAHDVILIENIPLGNHSVELFFRKTPGYEPKALVKTESITEEGIYKLAFKNTEKLEISIELKNSKTASKNGTKHETTIFELERIKKAPSDIDITRDYKKADYIKISTSKYATERINSFKLNLSHFFGSLPSEAEPYIYLWNFAYDRTIPIKETPFIWGFGSYFTHTSYEFPYSYIRGHKSGELELIEVTSPNKFFNMGLSISGGYQYEIKDKFVFQGLVKAKPNFYVNTIYSILQDYNSSVGMYGSKQEISRDAGVAFNGSLSLNALMPCTF